MDIVSALWSKEVRHFSNFTEAALSAPFSQISLKHRSSKIKIESTPTNFYKRLFLLFGPSEVSGIEKELWAKRLE